MARGRMLSKEAGGDPHLNSLSLEGELLYLLAIAHLDRDGLMVGDPVMVWAAAAPKRVELLERAPQIVNEWVERGLVIRYEWRDGPILFFKGFRKHNASMVYEREPESKYPPPPGWHRTSAGLAPDDPEARERLAQSFDSRSAYYRALMESSREVHEVSMKSTGKAREKSGKGSGKARAEDQDQDQVEEQHQHQQQHDDDDARARVVAETADDDDEVPSAVRGVLEDLAICWAADVREWTGAEWMIRKLDDGQMLALLSWLFLHGLLYDEDPGERSYNQSRYADANPFARVENPVGKIITQARLGNMAPLLERDREVLGEVIREEMGEVSEDEILFG